MSTGFIPTVVARVEPLASAFARVEEEVVAPGAESPSEPLSVCADTIDGDVVEAWDDAEEEICLIEDAGLEDSCLTAGVETKKDRASRDKTALDYMLLEISETPLLSRQEEGLLMKDMYAAQKNMLAAVTHVPFLLKAFGHEYGRVAAGERRLSSIAPRFIERLARSGGETEDQKMIRENCRMIAALCEDLLSDQYQQKEVAEQNLLQTMQRELAVEEKRARAVDLMLCFCFKNKSLDRILKRGMPVTEVETADEEARGHLMKVLQYRQIVKEKHDLAVKHNLRLVIFVAKKYLGQGLTLEDLIQEGTFGLSMAVQKFDLTQGYKLATYAPYWIRQAISKACYDTGKTVRLPVYCAEIVNKVLGARHRFWEEMERHPEDEELADKMGITVAEVKQALSHPHNPVSLDAPVGDDTEGKVLGDTVEGPESMGPEQRETDRQLKSHVDDVLSHLTKREAHVLKMHYMEERTLESIGGEFKITRERARQIAEKAKGRVREWARIDIKGARELMRYHR